MKLMEVVKNPSKFLKREKELRDRDEPSPLNATRKGVWRILVISTILAVIALAIAWAVIGTTAD